MASSAVNIKIDDREFRRALRQIIVKDKKSVEFVLNDQAYRLAYEAMRQTKKATQGSINKFLRLKGWKKSSTGTRKANRTGEGRKRQRDDIKRGAFQVYNAWRNKKSQGGAAGITTYEEIEKHVNARKKSAGWVKAQWLKVMHIFSARGLKRVPKGGAQVTNIQKLGGFGKRAKPSLYSHAILGVIMDAVGKFSMSEGQAQRILEQGFRKAIPARTIDMQRKLAGEFKKTHKKHSGRGTRK